MKIEENDWNANDDHIILLAHKEVDKGRCGVHEDLEYGLLHINHIQYPLHSHGDHASAITEMRGQAGSSYQIVGTCKNWGEHNALLSIISSMHLEIQVWVMSENS